MGAIMMIECVCHEVLAVHAGVVSRCGCGRSYTREKCRGCGTALYCDASCPLLKAERKAAEEGRRACRGCGSTGACHEFCTLLWAEKERAR